MQRVWAKLGKLRVHQSTHPPEVRPIRHQQRTAARGTLGRSGATGFRLVKLGFSISGGTRIAGWFISENLIKMDDLGVPLFQETSIWATKSLPIVVVFFPVHDGERRLNAMKIR